MPERGPIPAFVLGGSGYVAGEALRLLGGHPRLVVRGVASSAKADATVGAVFPHLAGTPVAPLRLEPSETVIRRVVAEREAVVFAALPHGASAAPLDALLAAAGSAGTSLQVVDLGADFRFSDPAMYAAVYGETHGAPGRCGSFLCALPEHADPPATGCVAHPGCFTTAVVLAAYPLLALDLAEGEVFVSAVTGSSGSGRTPGPGTHHPERRSALHAYAPLSHRHEREMVELLAPASRRSVPLVEFVPHSGPFVRGIHATIRLSLREACDACDLAAAINGFYAGTPFVRATVEPPRLNEVIGTNRCRIGVAVRGRTLVLTAVIDNLVKGAAGGAVQWMNRMLGFEHDCGLQLAGLGWY